MENIKPTNVINQRQEHYEIKSNDSRYSLYIIRYNSSVESRNSYLKERLLVEGVCINEIGNSNLVDLKTVRIGDHTDKKIKRFGRLPSDLTDRIIELPEHVRSLLKRD
ncbi:hypothetical protein J4414_01715 [Candidatus Woesearchaeota archaeon]|nr:hypothetical protein [Candidatus Woesearchaeota archaeon]